MFVNNITNIMNNMYVYDRSRRLISMMQVHRYNCVSLKPLIGTDKKIIEDEKCGGVNKSSSDSEIQYIIFIYLYKRTFLDNFRSYSVAKFLLK